MFFARACGFGVNELDDDKHCCLSPLPSISLFSLLVTVAASHLSTIRRACDAEASLMALPHAPLSNIIASEAAKKPELTDVHQQAHHI